ncbi:hypothetical protein GCM10025857_07400 [Alicyclobacillus contaminans]|nr:hypothetical protein GCM10025857_07400 [Alicyclobacillus contaminans]
MVYQPDVERMAPSNLRELQSERLKETVLRVYERVPFYRQLFDSHGVRPDDIQSVADVVKLPFTRKKDFRDNYPMGLFAVDQSEVVRIHGSSGTKGKPTLVGYTQRDIQNWSECVARAIVTAGGRPGDVFHVIYGYGLFTGGLGFHYGAERLGMTVIPVSGGNTLRQITLMEDLHPRGLPARRRTYSTSPRPWREWARIQGRSGLNMESSAPSRGPRKCGASWRRSLV